MGRDERAFKAFRGMVAGAFLLALAATAPKAQSTDFLLNLEGGTQHINDTNKFIGHAEGAFALKTDNGFFFQGAIMAEGNNILSQYGESIGFGYEPKKFGFFLFADALQYHLDNFRSTNHYQIRPAFRYHTDKFSLSLYYAHVLGSEQYAGTVQTVSPLFITTDDIYNKALSHAGLSLEGVVSPRVALHFKGEVAEKSVYRVEAGAEFLLGKGWSLTASARSMHYGDYLLYTNIPMNNTWEAFIGFSYRFGERKVAHEALAYRLLMATDYPIVVQHTVKRSVQATTTTNHPPTITGLTANPNPATGGIDNPVISFTLNDVDAGDTISWTASLVETPSAGGSLNTTSGGPVASGTPVSITYTTGNSCNATVTITATDSHGGTSQQSVIVQVQ